MSQLRKEEVQLFSGGVDAYCTLARHIDEKPDLLSLWGSDIPYDDKNGWKTLRANLFDEAKKLELILLQFIAL